MDRFTVTPFMTMITVDMNPVQIISMKTVFLLLRQLNLKTAMDVALIAVNKLYALMSSTQKRNISVKTVIVSFLQKICLMVFCLLLIHR